MEDKKIFELNDDGFSTARTICVNGGEEIETSKGKKVIGIRHNRAQIFFY